MIFITRQFIQLLIIFAVTSISTSNPLFAQAHVHVLGVAQDAGRPQAGCRKTCCVDKFGKSRPNAMSTSLGITLPDNNSILVEATPDLTNQWNLLNRLNNNISPNAIFITHAHIGHYSGLIHLGREAMNTSNILVYGGPRLTSFLKNNGPWGQLVELNNIRLKSINENQQISFIGLTVKALKVPHRDEYSETFGYVFQGKSKTLLFIPDIDKWSKWNINMDSLIKTVDYALLDGTFFGQSELPGRNMSEIPHPFVSESIKKWRKWRTSEKAKVYFIHMNHSNPLFNIKSEEYETIYNEGFNVAVTGMSFTL